MPTKGPDGLTLIELVVAIVVIALGVTAVLAMLVQGFRGSPDPQLRIKTVELAQAYMEEIYPKDYLRPDPPDDDSEEDRSTYDELEDYDGLCEGTSEACDGGRACSDGSRDGRIRDSEGNPRGGRYSGYCVDVAIIDEGDDAAVADPLAGTVNSSDVRRIDIVITDPRGLTTNFAAYRLDF